MISSSPVKVVRRPEQLVSDDRRVIPRFLNFGHPPRVRAIFRRAARLTPRRAKAMLAEVLADFGPRHRDILSAFRGNYEQAASHVRLSKPLSEDHRLLIGSYFTMEYAIESAALFNPSIVVHPDQSGLPTGSVRFLLSLRATGEGHVSSIVFRRGTIDADCRISFDPAPRYAYSARPVPDRAFDKQLFFHKMHEHGAGRDPVARLLEGLGDSFSAAQLKAALDDMARSPKRPLGFRRLAAGMMWLAQANYELHFPPDCLPAEMVIFPATEHESRGMEDLRLARFVEENGQVRYVGTYTAYDGMRIHPMLLETADFQTFHVCTLGGRFARNKGMALFPRKVDGHYLMLSRHDGEKLYVLRSHDLHTWNASQKVQSPREPWELVQLGNCGSPLETRCGWLVITHGVGPMRRYCIGASLLDLHQPARLIGRLREPLLTPSPEEREGYVPNVLYSCGSMVHQGRLVIPYAMSDSRTAFATVAVEELLRRLQ